MARSLHTVSAPYDTRQLLACDPYNLETFAIPLQAGQGQLLSGTFLTEDGQRTTVATQTLGVLCFTVDSDNWTDGDVVTIYLTGKFLWRRVREANPSMIFDATAIATFRSKQISLPGLLAASGSVGLEQQWDLSSDVDHVLPDPRRIGRHRSGPAALRS